MSAPAHANHKVTESFKINSQGMNANFFGSDNCAAGSVAIFYSAVMTRTNGVKDTPLPTTFIEIDYQNICTGDAFLLSGTTDHQQATVRSDISSGTLSTTIPVSNDIGTISTTVTVSLSWRATGPLQVFKDKFRSNGGGVKFKQVTDNESRPAEATGTVTAIMPLSTGNKFTNLVFAPSVDAIIAKNLFGQVTVTRTFPN
ncbi:MAG TPA: hypothetical protein VFH73_28900 [Polyangia bacterium]|jgi:hypothetical protein|nr:hypothetical protein [Polyangia bacterium]